MKLLKNGDVIAIGCRVCVRYIERLSTLQREPLRCFKTITALQDKYP